MLRWIIGITAPIAAAVVATAAALYVDARAEAVAREVVNNEAPFIRYEKLLEAIQEDVRENRRLIVELKQ